jgi:antitoxin component YwqK of YwqJK toxin-antitoxin module
VKSLRASLLVLSLAVALAGCLSDDGHGVPRYVPPRQNGPFVTYWADDRVREDGNYREGRRHGHVRGYHPDGSLAFEGEFADGVPVGELVQNFPGGARAIVQQVEGGLLQGDRLEYWPSGELRSSTALVDGHRQGEQRTWHENGQLEGHGTFENDVPVGEWQAWDEQGRLASRTVYWTAGGLPAGYLETVQDASGAISVQTRMLIVDGDFLGRVTLWYPDGLQAGLVEYRNGMREGLDVSWDTSGRKRSEGQRVADLRQGVWTTWNEAGEVESRVLYEQDRAVGPAK